MLSVIIFWTYPFDYLSTFIKVTMQNLKNHLTHKMQLTLVYFTAFVVLGLTSASLGPTLPGLAQHLSLALSQISILFTVRSFGYMTGSLISGNLYDRLPGHPLIALVLIALAIAMTLVPIVGILAVLALLFYIIGICQGSIDVGGNTLIIWVHGANVGPFMNAMHFFWGIGAFISPVIVAQVINLRGNFVEAYWILAVLYIPVSLWLFRLKSPVSPHSQSQQSSREGSPVHPLLFMGIIIFLFLYVGGEVSMGGWVYSYAVAMQLGDHVTAAYLTSIFWGAVTAGRLLSIPLTGRIRLKMILLIDLLGVLFSLILMLAFSQSVTALWVGVIGTGLFMASIFPTMLAFAGQHMAITGKVTGWFLVGSSFGGMSVPWLIGQFFESIGPVFVMIMITACMAASLLVLFLVNSGAGNSPSRT